MNGDTPDDRTPRKAARTRGRSPGRGAGQLPADPRTTVAFHRWSTARRFAVGRDLASVPGRVVFRNDLVELVQYQPRVPTVHSVPLPGCAMCRQVLYRRPRPWAQRRAVGRPPRAHRVRDQSLESGRGPAARRYAHRPRLHHCAHRHGRWPADGGSPARLRRPVLELRHVERPPPCTAVPTRQPMPGPLLHLGTA